MGRPPLIPELLFPLDFSEPVIGHTAVCSAVLMWVMMMVEVMTVMAMVMIYTWLQGAMILLF